MHYTFLSSINHYYVSNPRHLKSELYTVPVPLAQGALSPVNIKIKIIKTKCSVTQTKCYGNTNQPFMQEAQSMFYK